MAGFALTQKRDAHGRWSGKELMVRARKVMTKNEELRKVVKLKIADAAAISNYTHHSDMINSKLWKNKTDPLHEEAVSSLNKALSRFPDHNGTVFREVYLSAAQMSRYKVGSTITEKGFISTTTKRNTGFGGDTRFVIHSKTGKQIWDHSDHPREREVLFQSGTKFKVLARKKTKNGLTVIYLQQHK